MIGIICPTLVRTEPHTHTTHSHTRTHAPTHTHTHTRTHTHTHTHARTHALTHARTHSHIQAPQTCINTEHPLCLDSRYNLVKHCKHLRILIALNLPIDSEQCLHLGLALVKKMLDHSWHKRSAHLYAH